jgi:hypothetical protein
MPDLRYRSFRMQVYARLCPTDLRPPDRERFLQLLEATDEDGMIGFFQQLPSEPRMTRALGALREARELGDRLNAMDRTLPVLPHTEVSGCYDRLRALGNDIGDMIAAEKPT